MWWREEGGRVSKRGYVTATGEAALRTGGSVVEVMLAKDVSGAGWRARDGDAAPQSREE